jgi:DnaJ-class molecular chaperone
MTSSTTFTDYYSLLGIHVHTSNPNQEIPLRTIEKAFKKKALKYHPDKNPDQNAKSKFEQLSQAIEILRDVNKRKIYDEQYVTIITRKKKQIEEDERAKLLRDDLLRREQESKQKSTAPLLQKSFLEKLRKETEELARSQLLQQQQQKLKSTTTSSSSSNNTYSSSSTKRIRTFTYTEHLEREKNILEEALRRGDLL